MNKKNKRLIRKLMLEGYFILEGLMIGLALRNLYWGYNPTLRAIMSVLAILYVRRAIPRALSNGVKIAKWVMKKFYGTDSHR